MMLAEKVISGMRVGKRLPLDRRDAGARERRNTARNIDVFLN